MMRRVSQRRLGLAVSLTNAATWASVNSARAAKKATCTPHSYSDPHSAVVRSMTISRCRSVR